MALRAVYSLRFPPRLRNPRLYVAASSLGSPKSHSFLPVLRCRDRHRSFRNRTINRTISDKSASSVGRGTEEIQAPTPVAEPSLQPDLLYEGPFASLTLRLKRLSLTSAVIGVVGLPFLSVVYGNGSGIPATGQLAVIATAGITAIGSTALLGYCFSPYVHYLERMPDGNTHLFRITTRDILARRVETTFDPATDVSPPPSSISRPFCNFMVRDMPMYVHPEMINDDELRVQLVGGNAHQEESAGEEKEKKNKSDDDELF